MRALAAVLAALLVLAACGSSSDTSTVSAGTYMKSVCNALGPWGNDVAARSRSLQPPANATASQRKQAVQEFLSAVLSDTNLALTRLRQAGSPNVSGGTKFATNLVTAFSQLKAAYARASQQAATLPTNTAAELQSALLSIASTVRGPVSNIERLVSLATPPLRQAAAKEPACTKLGGG